MHSIYRGRGHTKKQLAGKTRIPAAERKARTARKKLQKLFPFTAGLSKATSIFQHAVSSIKKR